MKLSFMYLYKNQKYIKFSLILTAKNNDRIIVYKKFLVLVNTKGININVFSTSVSA